MIALVVTSAMLALLAFASSAGATNLNVSTDSHAAGELTSLTLNTTLTGTGGATHQYGADFRLPASIAPEWYVFGTAAQRCPGGSFSAASTGITPAATAFSKSACPATAKVGTATLGGASGSIYIVNSTPLPSFGVYFDTGVAVPYGRKLDVQFNGTSAATLSILGLQDVSTTGLTLNFLNTSRPTLSPRIWKFIEPDSSDCQPTSQASATVYSWPSFTTAAEVTYLSSVNLTETGCGIGLTVETDTPAADTDTRVKVSTPLTGTGNDTKQYGASITLPASLHVEFSRFGTAAQQCSGGSFTALTTGFTPTARAFNKSACPAAAKIGTVTLGGMSGGIYTVRTTPLPSFGVYFDTGVTTPFGREVKLNYSGSTPTLILTGLPNASTSGLVLDFYNAARTSGLATKIFRFAEAGSTDCSATDAFGTVYTFPASGTVATATLPEPTWVQVPDC
jgi:hypothetical protein